MVFWLLFELEVSHIANLKIWKVCNSFTRS